MKEIERNIYVVDEIFYNELQYVYGDKRSEMCYVEYYHTKHGTYSCHIEGVYRDCLYIARNRSLDGRYKNFEFLIGVAK